MSEAQGGKKTGPVYSEFRCLIAGGGTGGHLFPAIAVARELEKRFDETALLFVAGRQRMESGILAGYGYHAESVDVEGLKGRGWRKWLSVVPSLPRSIVQSITLLRSFSPYVVLGMGGYSAGPVCLAARLLGIPTAIHEQNAFPGLTNRMLSRVVDRVFISFDESASHIKARSICFTGNPVREEFFGYRRDHHKKHDDFSVLVVGGSQGARSVNRVFVEALAYMKDEGRALHVTHQTGESDYTAVIEDYRSRRLEAEVVPFIKDMAASYNRADMVVGRAGATTISELAAMAKPSILIPYPYAANRHQEINAASLVDMGGAEMILERDMDGERLGKTLIRYMDDREALAEMGRKAQKISNPRAAGAIADELLWMALEKRRVIDAGV